MKKSVSMVQEAPEIAALQNAKLLPPMEPIVFHYMMVSLTAMFAEFGPEMGVTGKLAADDPRAVESYWQAIDKMIFGKSVRRSMKA